MRLGLLLTHAVAFCWVMSILSDLTVSADRDRTVKSYSITVSQLIQPLPRVYKMQQMQKNGDPSIICRRKVIMTAFFAYFVYCFGKLHNGEQIQLICFATIASKIHDWRSAEHFHMGEEI